MRVLTLILLMVLVAVLTIPGMLRAGDIDKISVDLTFAAATSAYADVDVSGKLVGGWISTPSDSGTTFSLAMTDKTDGFTIKSWDDLVNGAWTQLVMDFPLHTGASTIMSTSVKYLPVGCKDDSMRLTVTASSAVTGTVKIRFYREE